MITLNNILFSTTIVLLFIYYPLDIILSNLNLPVIHTYFVLVPLSFLLLIYYLFDFKNLFLNKISNFKISFFTYILMLVILYANSVTDNLSHVSDKNLLLYILYNICYFLLFFIIVHNIEKLQNTQSTSFKIYILFSITYFFLLFFSNDFNIQKSFIFGFNADGAIYLTSSIFIVFFSLYTMAKNKNYFIFLLILSLTIIITLGSRTGILFYLISLLYFYFKTFERKYSILITILLFTVITIYSEDLLFYVSENQRLISLIELNTQDTSIIERLNQFVINWKFIEKNYFTGLFMSEIITIGEGKYIHSYLSYLQSYGIIIFVFLNILIIKLIYQFFTIKANDSFTIFVNTILIYTLLEFLFSRSYLFIHLLFFLMFIEYYYTIKKTEQNFEQ